MLLRYKILDGESVLESDRVMLVFHGLTPEQQRLFHFQGEEQAVQIAGPGTSSVTTTCASGKQTITFRSDYNGGTNTLEFDGQRAQLTQGGRFVLVGDREIDLSDGRRTISFEGDTISVE
jgi:hypothetical protein